MLISRITSLITRYSTIVFAIIVVLVAGYLLYSTANELYVLELSRGGRGYVSDEVWYASSTRNILVEIFGVEPKQVDGYGATIVFKDSYIYRYAILALANQTGVTVRMDYTNINAIYVNGSRENVKQFIKLLSEKFSIQDVVPGWQLPDNRGIYDYLNLEHPPLGKYIIGLSMILAGDYPLGWRLPLIISGVATALLVFLIVLELTRNNVVALAAGLLFSFDTMTRSVFSIALLDGFTAFLSALSMYLTLRRKYIQAILIALISGTVKFTGLFALVPVVLIASWVAYRKTNSKGLLDYIGIVLRITVLSAMVFMILLVVVSAPLIIRLGFLDWIDKSLIFPLRWHLSVKCTGEGCPISSSPWDWIIGIRSFPLYYYPDGRTLAAESLYPLWFTSYVSAIVFAPIIYKGYRRYATVILFLLGVISGYIILWIIGSRTQYSFYAVQLAPFVHIHLFYLIGVSGLHSNIGKIALISWFSVFKRIIDLVERLLLLRD